MHQDIEHHFAPNGSSKALAVLFSPAYTDSGQYAYIESFSNIPINKLYIKDSTNCFYTTKIEKIKVLVQEICERLKIEQKVYWGCSQGAYGALMLGIDDKEATIIAVAPHLCLTHKYSAAYFFAEAGSTFDSTKIDLREKLMSSSNRSPIHLFLPLISGKDAFHVCDALTLTGFGLRKHYMSCHHGIESQIKEKGNYTKFIYDLLEGKEPNILPFLASVNQIEEAIVLKDLYQAEYGEFVSRRDINLTPEIYNYELAYWASRQLYRAGNHYEAIGVGLQAVQQSPLQIHYHITLANNAYNTALWSLAINHYNTAFNLCSETGVEIEPSAMNNYEIATEIMRRA